MANRTPHPAQNCREKASIRCLGCKVSIHIWIIIQQTIQLFFAQVSNNLDPTISAHYRPISSHSHNFPHSLDGDRFVCLTSDRFTAKLSTYFLRELQYEFGEKLAVILDNAPYFIAKDLKKQAAAEGLLLIYLPPHSPEMNPLEQCWKQLRKGRANRLFLTERDVEQYLKTILPKLRPPEVYGFVC